MEADAYQLRHLADLAEKADRCHCFTFTAFLNEAELSDYYAMRHALAPCGATIWGGREAAERVMIRFGDPEQLGYAEEFPIACIKIKPLQEKFAEALTHRDILGAVMHLGVKRSELGDIVLAIPDAYLFCREPIADYLCRELNRIRHTSVRATVTDKLPEVLTVTTEPIEVQVASERLDGVIAKVYRLSRSQCLQLFREGKIFLNGRRLMQADVQLKEADTVSVRGYGKFRFLGMRGTTRKGNHIVGIELFGGQRK